MKKLILPLMTVVILLSSMSCTQFISGEELKSDKTRVTSNASQADLETLVSGNSAFAFDLYQELAKDDSNVFFSPYSLSLALAMTYAGARGETESQMADVLHFDLPQDRLHAAFNLLDAELAARQQPSGTATLSYFQLDITNAIWGQKGVKFLSDFLDTLAENYDAGLRIADFHKATEEARQAINQWASEATGGRIPELIAEGDLSDGTTLFLANAIYFKARWLFDFDVSRTKPDSFSLLDGTTVTVPMMHKTMSLKYSEDDGYQAVELKYRDGDFSMIVLLPEEGRFEEFESSLGSAKLDEIIGSMEGQAVNVSMPKFSYDTDYRLEETLADMGMPSAFGGANFSGMVENTDLFIYYLGHKASISVDEEGTEAAAASSVAIAGLTELEFNMNRPFIYLIRDVETGTILFVGRVLNPNV